MKKKRGLDNDFFRKRLDNDFFRKFGFEIINIDPGPTVLCDSCNKDYTDSDEKGGIQFCSQAICPDCTPRWIEGAKHYHEEHYIIDRALDDETFKEFVYRVRRKE